MNNDLISRSALKEAIRARIENDNNEDFDKGYNIALQGVIELIDNAPTVEPEPISDYQKRALELADNLKDKGAINNRGVEHYAEQYC